jgi:hypothetical protein
MPASDGRFATGEGQVNKADDPGTRWLVSCTCGWSTRTASYVAADAAVIVHRQGVAPTTEHDVAYSRYDEPYGTNPALRDWALNRTASSRPHRGHGHVGSSPGRMSGSRREDKAVRTGCISPVPVHGERWPYGARLLTAPVSRPSSDFCKPLNVARTSPWPAPCYLFSAPPRSTA